MESAILFRHFFSFVFSFLIAFYLIPLMIKAAYRLRLLDQPDGYIKKQKQEVPYLGGVAVYVSFITTLGFVYPFKNHILWLIFGSTLLLFIGLIDDLKVLKPYQKFAGQCIAIMFFLKGGFELRTLFFSNFFMIFASAFWMLSIINAFNLVDVMDGLASLLAIISAVSFLVIGIALKQYEVTLLMISFIGALGAFFYYNKSPAKIYLGDAGSLFIGGVLSATPLLISWSSLRLEGYFAPLIILAVPLLIFAIPSIEICSLVVIRTFKGIPFYKGSPHHFVIYLQKKKWGNRKILWFAGSISFVLSLVAILFLFQYFLIFHVIISLSFIFFVWFYSVFFDKHTLYGKKN